MMQQYTEPTAKQKQIKRVLSYIEERGSITQNEASIFLSVERLPSRVCDMKRMGYHIESKWEKGKNQFGEPCRYKRYYMGSGAGG
jgi:hypothetical protein